MAGSLELHVINVQQGHALLALGPDGTTILIDGGKSGKGSSELAPYLAQRGYPDGAQLDYMIASHLDADHIGGLTTLIDTHGYDVGTAIYDNGSTKAGAFVSDFKSATASTTAGPAKAIGLGTVIELGGGATATAVAVHSDVLGHGSVPVSNENDLSVAMLIQHGDFDFIVAGDLGGGDDDSACTGRVHSSADIETPLAQVLTGAGGTLGPGGVEAMMVNHHGSHSSTNAAWFDRLSPSVAVIGVGPNGYGHPRQAVVDNVLGATAACVGAPPALVLQTDEGDVGHGAESLQGHVVGDVVFTTTGTGTYAVTASGAITSGPDERVAAGLPATLTMDEGPGGPGG
ncbi:MAG: MBL fold metallo-hydrolase [Myxococcota bacterium]